jgi:hypothetical protein
MEKITQFFRAVLLFPFNVLMGTVAGAPGSIDYTQAGADKRIPYAFSSKTILKFYDACVIADIANRDYEGEIKAMGDKVVINTTPDVVVNKYYKGKQTSWQDLNSAAVEMNITRAIDFAFKMDKIDLKQFQDKGFMDKCATDAAQQQKIYIDSEFLGSIYADAATANKGTSAGRKTSGYNLGTTGSAIAVTKTNIIDKILDLSGVAEEQNWPEDNRWLVLPSHFTVMLQQSDLKDTSMTGAESTLPNGRLGKLGKFTIYSSNLYTPAETNRYNILFGHKSAICFASQLVEVEHFDKLETTFGSGMKGLQVYDWKVTKPESMGVWYAYKG